MKPTPEQQKILNAKGRVIKINARAGTGKTATLQMIAKSNPGKKILYLVFNSRNRQEAKEKFPDNTDIHTIHSFALSTYPGQFDGFECIRPSQFLKQYGTSKETLSSLTEMYLQFFLNSAYPKLELAIEPFKKYLSADLAALFEQQGNRIVAVCREFLTDWYRNKKDCPHDFYLKLSHLENRFQDKLLKYDLILIDEGQDLSSIMIDALSTYKGRIILVGDTHQQIYGFRYAEDAMLRFPHDELYDLTLSFRFGPAIAQLATQFIRNGKNDNDFSISGDPGNSSFVSFYDKIGSIILDNKTAILCRTNFSLFRNAMYLRAQKSPFCFERDISAELFRTLDVHSLAVNKKAKIRDDLIKSFSSIKDLQHYAKLMEDFQLLNIIDLVNTYKSEFPDIVFELLELCKERQSVQENGSITISTIHASKGQEYDSVILDEDVMARLGERAGSTTLMEEVNVAYVGMTRAKKKLYLPVEMSSLFNTTWQEYAKTIPGYVPAGRRCTPSYPNTKSDREGASKRTGELIRSRTELNIGDTVRTPSGYGKIIELKDDRCLVALEGRDARVWEHRSSTVKVHVLPPPETFKKAKVSGYKKKFSGSGHKKRAKNRAERVNKMDKDL